MQKWGRTIDDEKIHRKIDKPLVFPLRAFYQRIRIRVQLLSLISEFNTVYVNNSKRIRGYKVRCLVDELEKISKWHSNFLGLIDFWELDSEFNEIFDEASKIHGNHVTRCYMLYQFVKQVGHLEGEIDEVGVHKGRSAKVIALASKKFNKNVHIFDTFTGMPETDPSKGDSYRKGAFSDTSLDEVRSFLSDCKNVAIYAGFFPDTAEPISEKTFSFVHVDVDIYRSVLDCCQFFYPRMVRNGIMIFDDPGFADCSGAKIAVDEFFSHKEEFPIYLQTAQVLVIKK